MNSAPVDELDYHDFDEGAIFDSTLILGVHAVFPRGKSPFFYVNPLQTLPGAPGDMEGLVKEIENLMGSTAVGRERRINMKRAEEPEKIGRVAVVYKTLRDNRLLEPVTTLEQYQDTACIAS